MFTPFSRPGSRLLPLTFFIIAALTAGARFLILDGDSWTWGAAGATLAAFAQGASHWPGLRQLDVSPRAWFRSALGTLAVWSAAMSAVTTTAATVMQARSPYYRSYDWFLATSGDYHHVDTDGAPYVLAGRGITAGSTAWTLAITFVVFLSAGLVGLAVGLSPNQKLAATVSLGAALILTAVVLFFVGVWLGRDLPTDEITAPVRLDHLPRFLMTLAACTPPALASLRLSGRVLRD